jgi:transcriptional regulator with XRE-family HTH domain
MSLTPAQCRAARGLLDWPQAKLAEAAKVGLSTVKGFESSRTSPVHHNLSAIRAALETAGVIFVDENGEGPGVRLRKIRQDNAVPKTIPLDDLNADNDE